jgi:hypothetical protein
MKLINRVPALPYCENEGDSVCVRRRKVLRIAITAAAVVLLALASSSRAAAQCKIGNGYPGLVNCGTNQCWGEDAIFPNANGEKWSKNPDPCSCTYSGGCTVGGEIRQFLLNEYAWEFQSRPAFFKGCDGSVLLVLPMRKPERTHAG